MNQAIPLSSEAVPTARAVNWPRVGLFVGLTFAVTWLLNLGLYLSGGLAIPGAGLALVTQMLIPAFCAILLETFVFADSPMYFRDYRGPARWFTFFYLGATLVVIAGTIAVLAAPGLATLIATIQAVLVILGAVVIIVVRWRGGKDTLAGVGMAGGRFRWWLIFGLGMVGYYGLSTLLNALFKLGTAVDTAKIMPQQAAAGWSPLAILGVMLLNTIIIGPLINMLAFFGEEYGWRGFLQRSLAQMGRAKGTFLVGLIWGLWHAPLILMGYNFPDNPVLGVLLMTIFCIEMAYFLAYAVYKSKGVWTAAFLHGINNNAVAFFFAFVYAPASNVFSFGVGVYGLASLAAIVLLLLRDPLWKEVE
jgi:membrane protease YdiL (CAAX protease family)